MRATPSWFTEPVTSETPGEATTPSRWSSSASFCERGALASMKTRNSPLGASSSSRAIAKDGSSFSYLTVLQMMGVRFARVQARPSPPLRAHKSMTLLTSDRSSRLARRRRNVSKWQKPRRASHDEPRSSPPICEQGAGRGRGVSTVMTRRCVDGHDEVVRTQRLAGTEAPFGLRRTEGGGGPIPSCREGGLSACAVFLNGRVRFVLTSFWAAGLYDARFAEDVAVRTRGRVVDGDRRAG